MKKQAVKKAFLGLGLLIGIQACSKDQQLVNRLEGDWELTNIQVFDSTGAQIPQTLPQQVVYHFNDCLQSESVFCVANITQPNTNTQKFCYRIADRASTFLMDTDNHTETTEDQIPARIENHNKTNFTFIYTKYVQNQYLKYKIFLQKI